MKIGFRQIVAGLGAGLLVSACVTDEQADYAGDPIEGRAVTQSLCGSCHSIEIIGSSPNPAAPPLRYVLANYRPDWLADDLRNSVSLSHLRMPTFYFGEHHADDVVAYLKTIQRPRQEDR